MVSLVLRPPLPTLGFCSLHGHVRLRGHALYTLRWDSFPHAQVPHLKAALLCVETAGAAAPAIDVPAAASLWRGLGLPRTAYRPTATCWRPSPRSGVMFVAAAIDFDPLLNQQFINEGAAKTRAGGGRARRRRAALHPPALGQPVAEPLSTPQRCWPLLVPRGAIPILFAPGG
ncbi:MAG: hypothetical protein IPK19_13230 [Chloroflexi bacterium]|nr:hypothetical protein [Chloroflexota bacterium]